MVFFKFFQKQTVFLHNLHPALERAHTGYFILFLFYYTSNLQ